MAREKEVFRTMLDRLDAAFPGKEIIKRKELSKFLGISIDSVKKHFKDAYNVRVEGYPKVCIARILIEEI